MSVYYEDDYVTLYHADCLEHPDLWTGADVLVTDPPYGIKWAAKKGRYQNKRQTVVHDAVTGDESTDVRDSAIRSWGDKPRIVFGSWKQPRPLPVDHRLVWWKQGSHPGPANTSWLSQDEEIYVTGRDFKKSSPPNRTVFATTETRPNEVMRIGHPTPKPLNLMEWLLERCQPEWVITDPFAGSGSTLVAAKALGRRAIGVELEEKYCEIAAQRLSQEVLPLWEGGEVV